MSFLILKDCAAMDIKMCVTLNFCLYMLFIVWAMKFLSRDSYIHAIVGVASIQNGLTDSRHCPTDSNCKVSRKTINIFHANLPLQSTATFLLGIRSGIKSS